MIAHLLMSALVLAGGPAERPTGQNDRAEVVYYGFGEAYAPVSKAYLNETGCRYTIRVADFRAIVAKGQSATQYRPADVRAAIKVRGEPTYYVDRDGVMLVDGEGVRIDRDVFAARIVQTHKTKCR